MKTRISKIAMLGTLGALLLPGAASASLAINENVQSGIEAFGSAASSVDFVSVAAISARSTGVLEEGDSSSTLHGFAPITPLSVRLVPEPSTVIAGALLLLPFGVSWLKSGRRNSRS